MQPLSSRARRTYFFVLLAVFAAAIVPLALFANGWRFHTSEGIVRTGGVFLRLSGTGVTATIDGEVAETNSLLQRNIFVQNLIPGTHTVSVAREGYHAWEKTLPIVSEKVTEAHPLLVPVAPVIVPIPEFLSATSTATGTLASKTKNPGYATVAALFAPAKVLPKSVASSTPQVSSAKLELVPKGNELTALWHGSVDNAPFYFCTSGTCVATTTVTFSARVMHADFYPGEQDFVLVALPDGIYAAELDARFSTTVVPLLQAEGADFRVGSEGRVYIRQGKAFSELVL